MFENDVDFDFDDDCISSSFATSQPKSRLEGTPNAINTHPTEVNIIQHDNSVSFKKPVAPGNKPTIFSKENQRKQYQQYSVAIQPPKKTPLSTTSNLEGFEMKERDTRICSFAVREQNPRILEYSVQTKKVIKRKFPGPAGLLPDDKSAIVDLEESDVKRPKDNTPSQNDNEILCSQQSASVFDGKQWTQMMNEFNCAVPNGDFLPDKYNIKWIKHNANCRRLIDQKVPFLAAIVHDIMANTALTSINLTLKDPTGEIDAAILHTLYADWFEDLTIGSVIVLKQFGVFTTGGNRHCVTITPNNLITVYSKDDKKHPESGTNSNQHLIDTVIEAYYSRSHTSVGANDISPRKGGEQIKHVDQTVCPSIFSSQSYRHSGSGFHDADDANISRRECLTASDGTRVNLNPTGRVSPGLLDLVCDDAEPSHPASLRFKEHKSSSNAPSQMSHHVVQTVSHLKEQTVPSSLFNSNKKSSALLTDYSDSPRFKEHQSSPNVPIRRSHQVVTTMSHLNEHTLHSYLFDANKPTSVSLPGHSVSLRFEEHKSSSNAPSRVSHQVVTNVSHRKEPTIHSNLLEANKKSSSLLPGCHRTGIGNNLLNPTCSRNDDKATQSKAGSSHVQEFLSAKNSFKEVVPKSKKVQNLFELDDDLSLGEEFCTEMDFEMDVAGKGGNKNDYNANKVDLPVSTKASDADQLIDKSNFDRNNCESDKFLSRVHTGKDTVDPPLKKKKIQSALEKYKFKPKICDDVSNDVSKCEHKEASKVLSDKECEKENVNAFKKQSLIVSNSQLSVISTNAEHNQIWKNVLDDIDTDSLFEDF